MNAAQKTDKEESPSIYSIARKIFEDANGDLARARAVLNTRILRSKPLREELIEEFMRIACSTALRGVMQSDRARTWLPPNYDKGGNGKRVLALAASNERMLLDFPLWDGKKLRDATKEEVERDADHYVKQGKTMLHRGQWLQAIAKKLQPGQRVGKALTEAQLRKLQEEAANA